MPRKKFSNKELDQYVRDEALRTKLMNMHEVWVRSEPHQVLPPAWVLEPGKIEQIHDETIITMGTPRERVYGVDLKQMEARVLAWAQENMPNTMMVNGLLGPIKTGRDMLSPEAGRRIYAEKVKAMHEAIQKRLDDMAFNALTGKAPVESKWRDEQNDTIKAIDFGNTNNVESRLSYEQAFDVVQMQRKEKKAKHKRMSSYLRQLEAVKQPPMLGTPGCPYHDHTSAGCYVSKSKYRMSNYDKRMLRNDELGVEEARRSEVVSDLFEDPLMKGIQDAIQEGGWVAQRTLPSLNEHKQARALAAAAPTIREDDDCYDYYYGLMGDDFDETLLPKKPEKDREPQQLYGSGQPDRRTGRNGDNYTDNKEGLIYTRKEGTWRVTGGMSTNPNTPERQAAIAKEAQQKRARDLQTYGSTVKMEVKDVVDARFDEDAPAD